MRGKETPRNHANVEELTPKKRSTKNGTHKKDAVGNGYRR